MGASACSARPLDHALARVRAARARRPPRAAAPPSPGGSRVDRVVLENGLTVLLLPEPGTGLVSVGMMYTVGAKNEAAGTTGLAHYAEHMNFRATARFPGHEITEAITRRGGRWTGYTWIDQTFFQTTLGKEHLGLALDIEADRMGGALYDEKDFASERTSVVAELRSYDDPHSLLYDEVLGAALLVHPYRNNTIGWLTDVEAVTRDVAYAFYRRFYTPRNAVLVVGGDFDPQGRPRADRGGLLRPGPGRRPHPRGHGRAAAERRAARHRAQAGSPGGGPDRVSRSCPRRSRLPRHGPLRCALRRRQRPLVPAQLSRAARRSARARGRGVGSGARGQDRLPGLALSLRLHAERHHSLGRRAGRRREGALRRRSRRASSLEWTGADLDRARREVRAGMARDLDSLAGRVHQLAFFEVSGGYEHLAALESRLEATSARCRAAPSRAPG